MAATNESFLDAAPSSVVVDVTVERPAPEVWAELTEDNPMSEYCRAISRITWTSPRPFGIGTTRTTTVLGGLIRVHETYPHWDEGRRKVFVGVRTFPPVLRRLAEEYLVLPIDAGRCQFRWTAAWEPTTLGRPIAPIGTAIFESIASDLRRHFEAAPESADLDT
jgi:hypothetical protein